ncbi:hypothetical protein AHAS_Ahas05G0190200 [Arachis hypogaea]
MFRRLCCLQSTPTPSLTFSSNKKPLVLLGAPQVSAIVLDALLNASSSPHSSFQVAAIVTQPAARRDRGKKLMPSPLASYALDRGFSSDLIFTPERAGEDAFLSNLKALQPELCVTAAYGNILPTKFLDIPALGTVNIHPSLLPLYRGAAPVQRALQDGVKETGVSLAFTVRELDAGPIIASETVEVDDQIKLVSVRNTGCWCILCSCDYSYSDICKFWLPNEFISSFDETGSELLIRELPSIFDGSASVNAQPQDHSKATLAPKISQDESWLVFDQEASVLHNKVRAFSGWPGTRAKVQVVEKNGEQKTLDMKIITTRVHSHESVPSNEADDIAFVEGALVFPCGKGTNLESYRTMLHLKTNKNNIHFTITISVGCNGVGTSTSREKGSNCSCFLEWTEGPEAKEIMRHGLLHSAIADSKVEGVTLNSFMFERAITHLGAIELLGERFSSSRKKNKPTLSTRSSCMHCELHREQQEVRCWQLSLIAQRRSL